MAEFRQDGLNVPGSKRPARPQQFAHFLQQLLEGEDATADLGIQQHCGDHDQNFRTTRYGRVSNEVSVRREAFVYKELEMVNVTSHHVRLANVHYVDKAGGIDVTRDAFMLEDTKDMAKRFGGDFVDPTETIPWSSNPAKEIGLPGLHPQS